ncbi:MAG: ribonuclease R, partial [Fimbriimonadaceae bacterium]|nr:ribonuclease R [Alphaproteobacteria bacterium]
ARQNETSADGRPVFNARVIKRIGVANDSTLGILRKKTDGSLFIEQIEKKAARDLVVDPKFPGDANPGDLVSVEIQKSGKYGPLSARITKSHGPADSQRTVSRIAIVQHGIPYIFPEDVLREAEKAKPAAMENRVDLRDLSLITIDPADARDHDDAVFAEADTDKNNPGGWVVTVAIADVAHYVTTGSALDREARLRGNSVYFPDLVVPMLPERISNDLCSLVAGADRPAMAIRMVFDAEGTKKSHKLIRIMMRSAAGLSYKQAQAAIDGHPDEVTAPLLEPVLKPLWAAYRALHAARIKREPLELDLPERKIILNEDGTIERIEVPPRLDAHRLIEEYMIQANVAAAEILEQQNMSLLYRVHDSPSAAKLEALGEFLKSIAVSAPKVGNLRPSQFNWILDKVRDTEFEDLTSQVVLRSQAQAEYLSTNYGHFGLNLHRYTHFTSPIRRYADLIVHRALISALKLGRDGLAERTIGELPDIAAEISDLERRAMKAERSTVDRLIAYHLAGQIGAQFKARISGVTKIGLFVELNETGADGFIPVSSLQNDYFHFDEARHALIGERTGEMHRLGDAVDVRLVEARPVAGALRFDLLTEGRYVPKAERGQRTTKRSFGSGRTAGKSRAPAKRSGKTKKARGRQR